MDPSSTGEPRRWGALRYPGTLQCNVQGLGVRLSANCESLVGRRGSVGSVAESSRPVPRRANSNRSPGRSSPIWKGRPGRKVHSWLLVAEPADLLPYRNVAVTEQPRYICRYRWSAVVATTFGLTLEFCRCYNVLKLNVRRRLRNQ